jgi:FkbM family methyltransferase
MASRYQHTRRNRNPRACYQGSRCHLFAIVGVVCVLFMCIANIQVNFTATSFLPHFGKFDSLNPVPVPRDDIRRQGGIGTLENIFHSPDFMYPYSFKGRIVPKGRKVKIKDENVQRSKTLPHKPKLVNYGTKYGGWMCDVSHFNPNTVVYDVGLGEDTSWDEGLIKNYNLQVYGYDPTPKSKVHVDKKFPKKINFHFLQEGLSKIKAVKTFTKPRNKNHVSMREGEISGLGGKMKVQVNILENWMKLNGHTHIDVLKLDIEGSEYDVLEDWISRDFFPFDQLLVEWHFRYLKNKKRHNDVLLGLKGKGWIQIHSKNEGQETVMLRAKSKVSHLALPFSWMIDLERDSVQDNTKLEKHIKPSLPLMEVAKTMAAKLPQHVLMIQVLNAGYVEMTLSWICNVQRFLGVIDRTLFIATDQDAYESLKRFDNNLNVVLHEHITPKSVKYGQYSYYDLMLFRTKMLTSLLNAGISLFLTESDAVWLSNPIDYVLNFKGETPTSVPDIVTMSDVEKESSQYPMLQGGFQLLRATEPTKQIWNDLTKKFARIMEKYHKGQQMESKGNEQLMLSGLTSKAKKEGKLNIQYLPFEFFQPGFYYNDVKWAKKSPNPKIILNNWIIGNPSKVSRAKAFGHWFLMETDDQYFCLEPPQS